MFTADVLQSAHPTERSHMQKVVSLTVRVPGTLNRLIERKAVRDGIPKSEVIRIALIRYLVQEQPVGAGTSEGAGLQEETSTRSGTPRQKGTA
jgi:hypothetical protein